MSETMPKRVTIYALRWSYLRRKLMRAKNKGWKVLRIYTVYEMEQKTFMAWEKLGYREIPVRCADLEK